MGVLLFGLGYAFVFYFHSLGRPGTSCLSSLEACISMPSCLSQMFKVQSLGCSGTRMSSTNPWVLQKHQGKRKTLALAASLLYRGHRVFSYACRQLPSYAFPWSRIILFSLLLCRKPKKSTQAEVPGYALNPKTQFTAPSTEEATCSMY